MTFSEALEILKSKGKVLRKNWNGKGMYLLYFSPVEQGLETITIEDITLPLTPFIVMKTADNMYVPWLASQTDILANDWESL